VGCRTPLKHPLDKYCERDKNCCDIIKIDYASTENASSKLRSTPTSQGKKFTMFITPHRIMGIYWSIGQWIGLN
jgi:hypothetical protein